MVLHCFRCGDEAEVKGVQGILDAYRDVFTKSLAMSTLTDLTEVIRTASTYAQDETVRFAWILLRCNLLFVTLFADHCIAGNGGTRW